MSKIASRYSLALLELAKEEDSLDFYCEQLKRIKRVFKTNSELLPFLKHYLISKEDKKKVIDKIFADDSNQSIVRFIYLIVDNNRHDIIEQIIDDFLIKANEEQGRIMGQVYSIDYLSDKQIKEIEEAVSERFEYRVMLENMIDTELLSGIKVVVRDRVIDGSLKSRINMLKNSLLNRGE